MKVFIVVTLLLFGGIGIIGWSKREQRLKKEVAREVREDLVQEVVLAPKGSTSAPILISKEADRSKEIEDVDRIQKLFALDSSKLPIVETVSFTSRVPWLKGRPAWIADYASHYGTSRHFIARSLNKKADYFTQKVSPGDRFNVFKKDKDIQFHLLIDLSKCRLWFYCLDKGTQERYLLKTYRVGLGRQDSQRTSGYLTPLGKYELGDKIAIYKPGATGFFQDEKVEMIRVFGTRWIPFGKEIEGCTEAAKGFGIHGAPWVEGTNHQIVEDRSKIGKYDSDGCIRLASEDIEEIFSIIITKPTIVELVKDFKDAKLPGHERGIP